MTYFKQNNGTIFSVSTDELIAETYIDDAEECGVNFDSDCSWHYHTYNFDLLDVYTLDKAKALLKNKLGLSIDDDIEDMDDLKEYLQELSFYYVRNLYNAVNDDDDNNVRAFIVEGYSQGEATFVWFKQDETMPSGFTPKYFRTLLYASWLSIDSVDQEGELQENIEVLPDTFDVNELSEYMLEKYSALPAQTKTVIL